MTLSSRHRIRNSSPGGLRPSTPPLGHGGSPQYWLSHVDGEEWARRTSWGWRDEWDDTALQTHDSKFMPWRSEAEHATSRSRRLPTILTFTRGWGRMGQENLLRMERRMRWHCPPDTWFKIHALVIWGRALYLSVTEVPHNINFILYEWAEEKRFVYLNLKGQSGVRTRDLRLSKQAVLTTAPEPPPWRMTTDI